MTPEGHAKPMRMLLVPTNGDAPIEIVKDLTLVGRQEICDLCLDDKSISKQHCLLLKTEGRLVLRDLDSTNGCRINGLRLKRGDVRQGDFLSIANLEYRLTLSAPAMADCSEEPPSDRTERFDSNELAKLGLYKDSTGLGENPPSAGDDSPTHMNGDISLSSAPNG